MSESDKDSNNFVAECKVISVDLVQTTGHRILDDATISTLKRWRAAAGTPFTIVVPITYTKPLKRGSFRNAARFRKLFRASSKSGFSDTRLGVSGGTEKLAGSEAPKQ